MVIYPEKNEWYPGEEEFVGSLFEAFEVLWICFPVGRYEADLERPVGDDRNRIFHNPGVDVVEPVE